MPSDLHPETPARTMFEQTQRSPHFRLDRFEVTVGRFRRFKGAWDAGWRPTPGQGKHTHINGGAGLNAIGASAEPGWAAWDPSVQLNSNLVCGSGTWSSNGVNDRRPMDCINFYEAYAFCIWDGGFLPTEAEWNYVAAGGDEQRVYPWSSPPSSTTYGCANGAYECLTGTCSDGTVGCTINDILHVGTRPAGDGRWGHADLGGNVFEWNLDSTTTTAYGNPTCVDCVNLTGASQVMRGGGYYNQASMMMASYRSGATRTDRGSNLGVRCARSP